MMRADPPPLVLHVAESAGWAGGETYLVSVARALDRRRFRLAVVVPEPGPLAARLAALDVPTHHVALAGRLLSVRAFRDLHRLFRRLGPAIVQSHGGRTNVYARLAARAAGVPVVLSTVHNSLYDYEVSRARRRAYVLAEKATSALADRLIAVSDAIARDLRDRYGIAGAKVTTVRNGIDADGFTASQPVPAVLKALDLGPDDRLVGVAGRMTAQKGHRVLLEALVPLARRIPGLRCLLVGDGPLRRELEERAAALGVHGHCRFLGARSDMADVLSVLEVVVLPSWSEGLPFVLLESMALGRPVVATAVGGNPEVVEPEVTGLLVPAGDPRALAEALARLLAHPEEARAMGARAAVRVRREFTLRGMVGNLERLYASLLEARGVA